MNKESNMLVENSDLACKVGQDVPATTDLMKIYFSPCAADLQSFVQSALGTLKDQYLLVVGKTPHPPALFEGDHYFLRIGPRHGSNHVTVGYVPCPNQAVYRRCTHKGLGRMIMKLEPGV